MTQPDARQALLDALTDPPEWDADITGLPETEANRLLDAHCDQVLAVAAGRVLDLQVREPSCDVDHHVNDVLARVARAVQQAGVR